jgi:hypothetical protein
MRKFKSFSRAEAPASADQRFSDRKSQPPQRHVFGLRGNSSHYLLKRHSLFILILLCCLFGLAACKQQETTNSWAGTWNLDLSKSRLNEPPKQETMQIESADRNSIKYSIRGISAEGKEYLESYNGKPDGNAYPVKVNGKELGKIAFHWQSDRMCSGEGKGIGGSSVTETATLSDDGKTITIKSREGKEEEETAVYTK